MPRRKAPKTLKSSCLDRVAKSIDNYWFSDFDKHFSELPRLVYVIGPFDHFTGDLIQELLAALFAEKCLKRKHFQFLLQSAVSVLNLSNCGAHPNHDSVIKLLNSRCPRLVQLNLKSLNQISPKVLADLVSTQVKLKSLCLSGTKCNDQVLSVIGHYSIDLRELDVSSTFVTDSGAFSMVPGFLDRKDKPGCPNLVKLDISGTAITQRGAGVLLARLHTLHYLHFADVCALVEDCVSKKHGDRTETNQGQSVDGHPTFPLKSLTTTGLKVRTVTDQSVQLSCELCPNVTEVHLFYGMTDSNVGYLSHLKHLKMLELANTEPNHVTFEAGLLPVLLEIGQGLLTLCLHEINNIDMSLLGTLCLHLRKLSIIITENQYDHANFTASTLSERDRGMICRELQTLTLLFPTETESFPSVSLQTLLCNAARLQEIHFLQTHCLTTDMLHRVCEQTCLTHLRKLKLELCHGIDEAGIMLLLEEDNNLSVVELKKCGNIRLQDVERMRWYTRDMQYNVQIDWS